MPQAPTEAKCRALVREDPDSGPSAEIDVVFFEVENGAFEEGNKEISTWAGSRRVRDYG